MEKMAKKLDDAGQEEDDEGTRRLNIVMAAAFIFSLIGLTFFLLLPAMNDYFAAQNAGDFSGKWYTSYGDMVLEQDGVKVTGTYGIDGTLEGKVSGDRLEFEWKESWEMGEGYFVLSEDGESFIGRWKYDYSQDWYTDWDGSREPLPYDEVYWEDDYYVPEDDFVPYEAPALPEDYPLSNETGNFSGTWYTTWGEMELIQNGTHVTGTYDYASGLIEGAVIGNKLTFVWTEQISDSGELTELLSAGPGYFILSPDGKSFRGAWKYDDSTEWYGAWEGFREEKDYNDYESDLYLSPVENSWKT